LKAHGTFIFGGLVYDKCSGNHENYALHNLLQNKVENENHGEVFTYLIPFSASQMIYFFQNCEK